MTETINKIKAALEEAYAEHFRLDGAFAVSQQRIGIFEREIEFIQKHPRYNAPDEKTLNRCIEEEKKFSSEIVEKIYDLEDLIKSLETSCRFAELFEERYLEEK